MNIFETARNSIKQASTEIFDNINNLIYILIQIILIIIAAKIIKLLVTSIIKKAVKKHAGKKLDSLASKKSETLSSLLINISKYVILFLEVTAILSILGLGTTVTSLLTTAGIGGLAIGLGAQSLINDATNGFFILIDDEYAIGDYIKIDDFTGTVDSISIRTTRLRLANNEIVTIPNGKISTVVNYTRDNYQLFVDAYISTDEDTALAGKIMLETAKKYTSEHDFIINEPSFLGAVDINAAHQKLRISVTLKPLLQWKADRELKADILKAFKENNIKLPKASESIFIKE